MNVQSNNQEKRPTAIGVGVPDAEVVKALEKALEDARQGNLVAVTIVGDFRTHVGILRECPDERMAYRMLGALTRAQVCLALELEDAMAEDVENDDG